jgi:hypothetical protein
MSRRIIKICVAGALLVSALAGASSATATSWSTNFASGPSFTASAPPSKFKITATGGKVSGLLCSNVSYQGALNGGSNSGPSWTGIMTVTPIFSSCTLAGQPATVTCQPANLNALSYEAGRTNLNVTGIVCRIVAVTAGCGTTPSTGVTLTGTLFGAYYENATFRLTIPIQGQSLQATWSAGGCTTLLGTSPGTVLFGATPTPNSGDPTTVEATITSTFKPSIVQP